MSIKMNKLFSRKPQTYFDPKLVREVEMAREKAWHDIYLKIGLCSHTSESIFHCSPME